MMEASEAMNTTLEDEIGEGEIVVHGGHLEEIEKAIDTLKKLSLFVEHHKSNKGGGPIITAGSHMDFIGVTREHFDSVTGVIIGKLEELLLRDAKLEAQEKRCSELEEALKNANLNSTSKFKEMNDKIQRLIEIQDEDRRQASKQTDASGTAINTINATLKNLQIMITESSTALNNQITVKIDQIAVQNNASLVELDNKYKSILDDLTRRIDETELKLFKTCDSVSLFDMRMKTQESTFAYLQENLEHLRHLVQVTSDQIDNEIKDKLKWIEQEKVGRMELAKKADISSLIMKADMSEMTRHQELLDDLSRRISSVRKEALDGFALIDKNANQRAENTAIWCLKQIRKELRENAGGDNADIGKVRCLVCDQVVKQDKETDIIHGGPSWKATVKPKHDDVMLKATPSNRPVGGRPTSPQQARPSSPVMQPLSHEPTHTSKLIGGIDEGIMGQGKQSTNNLQHTQSKIKPPDSKGKKVPKMMPLGGVVEPMNDESVIMPDQQPQQNNRGTYNRHEDQHRDFIGHVGGQEWWYANVADKDRRDHDERDFVNYNGAQKDLNLGTGGLKQSLSSEQQYFKDLEQKFHRGGSTARIAGARPMSAPSKRIPMVKKQQAPLDFR